MASHNKNVQNNMIEHVEPRSERIYKSIFNVKIFTKLLQSLLTRGLKRELPGTPRAPRSPAPLNEHQIVEISVPTGPTRKM